MNYSIDYDGKTYELVNYTVDIASKIDSVTTVLASERPISDKLKLMYKTISELIGVQETETLLKPLNQADPNAINIVFMKIVSEYEKPATEFKKERNRESYDPNDIEMITKFLGSLPNINMLTNMKSV